MGDLYIGSSTKGFTGMSVASSPSDVDSGKISPALKQLLSAIEDSSGGPVEINISIKGSQDKVFTINVDDVGEIQEILQWSVGR
jgi:hypothetical protein